MKKLLLTSATTLMAVAAFAQGTVAFSNGGLNKCSTGGIGSAAATWVAAPANSSFSFGLFYGFGTTQPTSLTMLPTLATIGPTPGVFGASDGTPLSAVLVPGTQPNDANVWFQVKGWSTSLGTDWAKAQAQAATTPGVFFGQTAIVNAAGLGPSTGPGVPIWQTAAGTNPNKFPGGGIALLTVVPEPTTMALAGLGVAALMIFRRRK